MGYLQDLPLDRFLPFVWHMLTRYSKEPEVADMWAKLWRPPPGTLLGIDNPRSPWNPENETKAFRSVARALGAVGR